MANPTSRPSGFASLPVEILIQIAESLDYRSLSHLAQTNAGINGILRDGVMREAREHAFLNGPNDGSQQPTDIQPLPYDVIFKPRPQDPIGKAIENHNYDAVKNYLDAGISPNSRLRTGLHLLYKAASWKAYDITTLLLEYGADVNIKYDEYTALAAAALQGDDANVCRLLRVGTDVHGKNTIHTICEYCNVSTVRLAVEQYGANLRARSTLQPSMSAIHHAAQNPDAEVLAYVVQVAPEALNDKTSDNRSALWLAVENTLLRNVGILLDEGIDLSCRDSRNETVLYRYLYMIGKTEVPMFLLQRGITLNGESSYDRKTELHHAVSNNCEQLAAALITRGLSANAADDRGRTPLHLAVLNGELSMARVLVEQGHACLDAVDYWGDTPLSSAQRYRRLAVAAYLEDVSLPGRLPA